MKVAKSTTISVDSQDFLTTHGAPPRIVFQSFDSFTLWLAEDMTDGRSSPAATASSSSLAPTRLWQAWEVLRALLPQIGAHGVLGGVECILPFARQFFDMPDSFGHLRYCLM